MGVGTVFSFKQMIDFVWSFIHNWLLKLLIWDEMIRLVDRGVLALMALEIDEEFFLSHVTLHGLQLYEATLIGLRFERQAGLSTAWQQLPAPICSDEL